MQANAEKQMRQAGQQAGSSLSGAGRTWTSGQMAACLQDRECAIWKQIQWLKGANREKYRMALIWKHSMLTELMKEFGIPALPLQWGSGPVLDTEERYQEPLEGRQM